jgi:predicted phosphodiesterase
VRRALISDIHGNLEALQAVMADIASQNVQEIYCLGDIIGYGPNPNECLDIVIDKCQVTILGNHDQAALFDPDGFNPSALQAIYWTRDQLDHGPGSRADIDRRWDFLGELPRMCREDKLLFVHGSPRDPTNEYVFPEFVFDRRKMDLLFGRVEQYCFQGHTHQPGVFLTPAQCEYRWPLESQKMMVNVGSVGQPRDGDRRSCYVVLDTDQKFVFFRRVEYDFEATAKKIFAEAQLADMLGERLRHGH